MDDEPIRLWLSAQQPAAAHYEWSFKTRRSRPVVALVVVAALAVLVALTGPPPREGVSNSTGGTVVVASVGVLLILGAGLVAAVSLRRSRSKADSLASAQAQELRLTDRQRRKGRAQIAGRVAVLVDERPYVAESARRVGQVTLVEPLALVACTAYVAGFLLLFLASGSWWWIVAALPALIGPVRAIRRRAAARRFLSAGPLA